MNLILLLLLLLLLSLSAETYDLVFGVFTKITYVLTTGEDYTEEALAAVFKDAETVRTLQL